MVKSGNQRLLYRLGIGGKALPRVNPVVQGQRIDIVGYKRLRPTQERAPVKDAHNQIGLATHAVQPGMEGGQQSRKGRDPGCLAPGLQGSGRLGI